MSNVDLRNDPESEIQKLGPPLRSLSLRTSIAVTELEAILTMVILSSDTSASWLIPLFSKALCAASQKAIRPYNGTYPAPDQVERTYLGWHLQRWLKKTSVCGFYVATRPTLSKSSNDSRVTG